MSMKAYVAMLVLLLGALAALIWKDVKKSTAQAAATVATPGEASAKLPPGSRQQQAPLVEQDWLVDEVVRDVAEMVGFAAEGKAFDANRLQVSTQAEGGAPQSYEIVMTGPRGEVSHALKLQHHLWSPVNYEPLAKALLAAWKVSAQASDGQSGSTLPVALHKADTGTFVKENKRVSEALNQHPARAAVHEEAALLIGTLAFREAAGAFSDIRPALGRMTAHLALAQALQTKPSACGQLATALQLTLVNRQTEALDHVAKLPPDLKAWQMALRIRNTGDWRLLKSPRQATLLEQLAYVRSLLMGDDANLLVEFLEARPPMAAPADVPDWARLALGVSFSVEEGHIFATSSIPKEFMDFTAAWHGTTGERPQKEALVAALNTPMTRAVVAKGGQSSLAALSHGALASFHQRHLLHAVSRTQYFFRELWGVDEEAANLEEMARAQLSKLTLYPLLLPVVVCNQDAALDARNQAVEFCKTHPRLVTAEKWATLERPEKPLPGASFPPPSSRWFTTGLVFGTALDVYARGCRLDCLLRSDKEQRLALARLAPNDFHLQYDVARGLWAPGSEEFKKALEPLADYNVLAARTLAEAVQNDPSAYSAAMAKVCLLDANEYFTLARHHVRMGNREAAARAYEAAFEEAPNRVQMANNSEWLINYYFDGGRRDDAMKVAMHAAEVYSFRGLEAAAKLMERLENWSKAREYYEAIQERYGNLEPLVGYLLRHKDHSPEVAKEWKAMVGTEFPDGMKNAALADFKDAPKTGAVVTSNTELTQQHGLKIGNVIVALDGYRVDTFGQYSFIRALKEEAPLQIILWDGSQYRELIASVPYRRFECQMSTYAP